MMVKWQISYLMGNLAELFVSASLMASMFSGAASGSYEAVFGFVNSPASALVILVLILANVFLSIKISAACAVRQRNALGGLARDNTHYSAFSRLWGPDMVVFGLNRIVVEETYKRRRRFGWVRELEQITIRYNSLSILVEAALNMAVFLFVAAKAFIGVFGIGSFILYQGAVKRFISAVSGMAGQVGALRQNNAYLISLYEYLDLSDDMYRGTLAVEKREDIDYEIEFRDVSFRYPHTESWALRHVSMKFRIGEKLAIVGENDSGKTTFIKLLCRLYDPTEGKILLNGIDITRYRYREYMALFSVVFQFISHRLSSCRFCDSIAVFDHGRLIQQGPHDVLAAEREGKYCQLWQAQAQYYKKDAHGISAFGGQRKFSEKS